MTTSMKMLMLIARSERREELEIFLQKEGLQGFSEIPDVRGRGTTGPRMGSLVAPTVSSMILVMVAAERIADIVAKLNLYCADCHEHLRIAHWDIVVETMDELP
ncbi:hypothetical protein HZB60_11490 [candidate division KSB1 bacterium]|nr:hypothetical protein [candidate division KSB1 bacterium]